MNNPNITKYWKHKTDAGFTIIELIVVIAIIAVLSGIVIINVNASINKSKAVRANTEVKNIENAFIMFYAKYGNYPQYQCTENYAYYSYWSDPAYMCLTVDGTPRYITEFLNIDWTGFNASYLAPTGYYYINLFDDNGDGKIGCGWIYLLDENYCYYGVKYILNQDCNYSQYDLPFTAEDIYPEDGCGGYGWWI